MHVYKQNEGMEKKEENADVFSPRRKEGINCSQLSLLAVTSSHFALHTYYTWSRGIRYRSTPSSLFIMSEASPETSLTNSLPAELKLLKWFTWQSI